MRHVKMVGLVLFAALMAGTAVAGSASAIVPKWGACKKLTSATGNYTDAGCTVPASANTGHYKWYPGKMLTTGNTLSSVNGMIFTGSPGPTAFETTAGEKIECADSGPNTNFEYPKISFQLKTPDKVSALEMTFTECKESSTGYECGTTLVDTETISNVSSVLAEGALDYISGSGTASPVVGLALTMPPTNPPTRFFLVECAGPLGTVWVGGKSGAGKNTVISPISPVDLMTTAFTSTLSQAAGIQDPLVPESGPPRFLKAFISSHWEQMGWSSTWMEGSMSSGQVEIKAVA